MEHLGDALRPVDKWFGFPVFRPTLARDVSDIDYTVYLTIALFLLLPAVFVFVVANLLRIRRSKFRPRRSSSPFKKPNPPQPPTNKPPPPGPRRRKS